MDDATRKAFFVNLLLVANADDGVGEAEREFLSTFVERAGITDEQVREWTRELRSGGPRFVPVDGPERSDEALALMVGIAAADGALGVNERRALLAWGRSIGLDGETVAAKVRERWGRNTLDEVLPPAPADAGPQSETILVVSDRFERVDAFIAASAGFRFDVRERAADVDSTSRAAFVVFHVAEDRPGSLATLAHLRNALPDAQVIAVAGRHEAFQISYLLEAGVHRCMVEPIYPGELAKLVARSRAD